MPTRRKSDTPQPAPIAAPRDLRDLADWRDRYCLCVDVPGRPVSENRARVHLTLKDGRKLSVLSGAAASWREDVGQAALFAVAARAATIPHPRSWPRPFHIIIGVRSRIDADNPVKIGLDALKEVLGVDDRDFDCTPLRRHVSGHVEGVTFLIFSAPLAGAPSIFESLLEERSCLWTARPARTTKPSNGANRLRASSRTAPVA